MQSPQYQQVCELAGLGAWKVNLKTETLTWTAIALEVLGYKEEVQIPKTLSQWIESFSFESQFVLRPNFNELSQGGEIFEVEACTEDGRWFRIKCRKSGDEALGFVECVTARRKIQAEIVASKNSYEGIIHNIDDLIWEYSLDKKQYTYFSEDQSIRIFGRPASDFLKDPVLLEKCIFSEDLELYRKKNEKLFTVGNVEHDYRILRPDGEIRWIRERKKALYNESGSPAGILGVVIDISIQKELEQKNIESEAFLRTVLENLPVAVFCKDAGDDFRFTVWNRAATQLWGLQPEQVIGKNDFDFFPKEQAEFFRGKDIETLKAMKNLVIPEEPIDSPGKPRIWLRTIKAPILDAAGNPKYLLGIAANITEEREQAEHLKTLFNLIEASSDGFGYADAKGKPLYISRFLIQALGWSPDVSSILDYLSDETRSAFEEKILNQITHQNKTWEGEVQLKNLKTGENVPFLLRVFCLKDKSGGVSHIALSSTDLRQRKDWEAAAAHSSKMASLGEMAGGIAHEINNPLAIILGKASQLESLSKREGFANEKLSDGLQKISHTAERIGKIVRGLRAFSRNGEKDPMSEVQISTIVDDVLALCQERFKNKGIPLEMGPLPQANIRCRGSQISQVLLNLFNNAYDAIEDQAGAWVRCDVVERDGFLEIAVTDSGGGISPEIVSKLMQPFFTTKPVGKGTGLGLSIAKGIIEEHGGRFFYDAKSKNTRFVIALPKVEQAEVKRSA